MKQTTAEDKFAYVTHNGELILMHELTDELAEALSARGFEVGIYALTRMVEAIRIVSTLRHDHPPSGVAELCELLAAQLRRVRLIVGGDLLTATLEEYLLALQRNDIAEVRYY